jgi:hypothetical protein
VREACLLARAQLGADFENGVVHRQGIEPLQFCQHVDRQPPAAATEFEDVAATFGKHRPDGVRQGAAEQRGQFRRGDEVACSAELGRAGGVIAEPRRVEHDFHVTRERDPATFGFDKLTQMTDHTLAVRKGFRAWGGQHRSACSWIMREPATIRANRDARQNGTDNRRGKTGGGRNRSPAPCQWR